MKKGDSGAEASKLIRVAVVDDSPLMRRVILSALLPAADVEVVGVAGDARAARELIRFANPDVITLDVEMPGMSGLDLLQKIMELRPTPVIMVSNLTAAGTDLSLRALQIGAIEVVRKPQGPLERLDFGKILHAKIRLAAAARPALCRRIRLDAAPLLQCKAPIPGVHSIIAIGASTGGVSALSQLLYELPVELPPIVIVQHMPKDYPARFAARLATELRRDISEARSGERLMGGMVRLAAGDRHLRVIASGSELRASLEDGPPVGGHRPSVDVLFESVAQAAGARAIGVILTGMGRDGASGLAAMRQAGAICLGQDRQTSAVWGMPRAARDLGALTEELPLDALASRICHYLAPSIRQETSTI